MRVSDRLRQTTFSSFFTRDKHKLQSSLRLKCFKKSDREFTRDHKETVKKMLSYHFPPDRAENGTLKKSLVREAEYQLVKIDIPFTMGELKRCS